MSDKAVCRDAMRVLTHLSLFSGIGGLDLAAGWAGIETIGQCEWADYPTKVLERHWPHVPRWKDIQTLTKESFYERTGLRTVDIISGGFPCQPFSVAGKQRGKGDDRYLWPEMVRVIKELRPAWVVGENVAGIVKMALPDILSELEAEGYRTRAFLIPACAVGARHRRYRVAIVGNAEHDGPSPTAVTGGIEKTGRGEQEGEEEAGKPAGTGRPGNDKDVAYTESDRLQREWPSGEQEYQTRPGAWKSERRSHVRNTAGTGLQVRAGEQMERPRPEPELERPDSDVSNTDSRCWTVWRDREFQETEKTGRGWDDHRNGTEEYEPREWRAAQSGLGGVADGIPSRVDGYWDIEPDIPRIASGVEHRCDRIKALGNAVVPQQFYPVFKAIADVERYKYGYELTTEWGTGGV